MPQACDSIYKAFNKFSQKLDFQQNTMKIVGCLRLFYLILFFGFNTVFAEHKIVDRIFKFLHPIEDYLTFEQNKPLLKLIFHNRNILFKELTQNNYPTPNISEIFLKLAVFTSENFDKIAPRDREFGFHKDQLKRFWQFIMKKIKLLSKSDQPIVLDVRFIKLPPSEDLPEKK